MSKFLFQKILDAKDEKLGVSPSLLNIHLFDCSFMLTINWYFHAYYEEDKHMNPVLLLNFYCFKKQTTDCQMAIFEAFNI